MSFPIFTPREEGVLDGHLFIYTNELFVLVKRRIPEFNKEEFRVHFFDFEYPREKLKRTDFGDDL